VTIREVRPSDAAALCALLTTDEVTRFIAPPPMSRAGFERFVARARQQRAMGTAVCFAVTIGTFDTAIGIFQVRLVPQFATAEWGFAIASSFWGTGIFLDAATLVLDFAFDTLDVQRVEGRVALQNGRGQGAFRKLGAAREGVLRRSFPHHGRYLDQALYAILADEWRGRTASRVDSPRWM
jgi:RimJ/RimL family protein N-acetyltransferase